MIKKILFVGLFLLMFERSAYAVFLGSTEIDTLIFGDGLDANTQFDLDVILSEGIFLSPDTVNALIFDTLLVSTFDEGTTFTATAATDPDFGNFVNVLTDGFLNVITVTNKYNGLRVGGLTIGPPLLESDLISGSPFPTNGIDFQGFTINSIGLTLAQFVFIPGGPIESPPGSDFELELLDSFGQRVVLSIFGEPPSTVIPEPSTFLLIGTGLAGLAFRRRLF